MKIRQGFVSNSSSSSFIINYNNECEKKFTVEIVTEILTDLIKVYNLANKDTLCFENIFDYVAIISDVHIKERIKYESHPYYEDKTDMKKVKNKIVIVGKTDNSIPYPIMEFIENTMDAKHWHWG